MRLELDITNELPPHCHSWTDLMNKIINSKDPAVSWVENNKFHLDWVDFDRAGSFSGQKIYTFDKDFIKARVLDEMWDDLDLNGSTVDAILMNVRSGIYPNYSVDSDNHIRKIRNLSRIRR